MTEQTEQKTRTEEFQIDGDRLVAKIKELLHEGNIRRITIKDESGQTLIEIPLTIGVVGALLLPVLAAVGAIAALVAKCTIVLEKVDG
jgi:competence protein ComGC